MCFLTMDATMLPHSELVAYLGSSSLIALKDITRMRSLSWDAMEQSCGMIWCGDRQVIYSNRNSKDELGE